MKKFKKALVILWGVSLIASALFIFVAYIYYINGGRV